MSNRNSWLLGFLAAAYITLLGLAARTHTFWRDEAEVWIVARDSHGLRSLLHNVRYEGHPPLWYAVNAVIAHFSWNPDWMKVANGLFAFAAIVLILLAHRVPLLVRIGLVFSYYMLFEYAVIDRSYMLGVLLLIASIHAMKLAHRFWLVPVLLGLAALTSVPAVVLAVCLYPLHLLPELRRSRQVPVRCWFAGALFLLLVLTSVAIVRPPRDSGLLLDSVPFASTKVALAHPFHDIAKAYLPLLPPHVGFWDKNVLDAHSSSLFTLLGLALVIALCFFFRHPEVRAFFLAATAILLLQMRVSRRTDMRHVGWLFIVFLLSLLLREVPWLDNGDADQRGWRAVLLYGVLAVQVYAGIFAAIISTHFVFSGSKAAAGYLRAQGLASAPMVFAPDFVGLPILAYLQRPNAFYSNREALGSIVVWNKQEFYTRHTPTRAELLQAAQNGVLPVLVTERPLGAADRQALGVEQLGAFAGGIAPDSYIMYQTLPSAADTRSPAR
jgi:hypothetical protein